MMGPRSTGLGVYAKHCMTGLARRFHCDLIEGGVSIPESRILINAPENVAIGGGKLSALRRLLWLNSLVFDRDCLVYTPTHHGLLNQMEQIITVHDLICLHFPKQHVAQYLYFRYYLPKILKKCRAVFTVSETTKQDIADTYDYPKNNIFVVPNGVDASDFAPAAFSFVGSPYLLMVGARYPHKNVEEVLDMARFWKDKYRLIVTSCGGAYRKYLEKKVYDDNLADRVEFRDYLAKDMLLKLYQCASALIYPSLWEGFGIPPLEALACGTPVIASDISVHREILGNAAIFVKLGDSRSWRDAFQSLSQPELIAFHSAGAQICLAKYTWKHAVDALEMALLEIEPRLKEIRR
jgi:glycosyltransferase involved in cell wall biosynthesis